MSFSGPGGGFTIGIKKVLHTIIHPFRWVFAKIWDFFSDLIKSITKIRQYRDRLEQTQKRLQALSRSYQEVEELRNQIRVLKEALGLRDELQQNYNQNAIAARVITRDAQNAYLSLIINKGSTHGIKQNMIVVGYFNGKCGVIGKVIETTPFTAKILPIHNKASYIGAMISRTRVTGIIEGQGSRGNLLNMAYILNEANVKVGDLIVSSMESDIFPQGLVVGHVAKIKNVQGAFHKKIFVKPFIKYNQIEIVFIIRKLPSQYIQRLERAR